MIKNILLIEDELFIAELYAQVLRSNDYTVTIVEDGLKGYEEAKTGKYDLLLLDLMLPNLTGIEILRRLRDKTASPNVDPDFPILVLTNLDEETADKSEILKFAQKYLLKVDITPKQLVKVIKELEG